MLLGLPGAADIIKNPDFTVLMDLWRALGVDLDIDPVHGGRCYSNALPELAIETGDGGKAVKDICRELLQEREHGGQ